MEEVIEAGCLGCGKVQRQVMRNDCRLKYPFMRDWEFTRIVEHFLGAVS